MCCCKEKCLVEVVCVFLKKAFYRHKNKFPLVIACIFGFIGLALLIGGVLAILFSKNSPLNSKDFFTGSGSAFAAAALMYGASCYQMDSCKKSSEFYLDKIKEYFKQTIFFIEKNGNNNIKWHQAIRSLRTAADLLPRLTESSHREIYIADYINTAYSIVDCISRIDYKFFYGVQDYEDKNEMELYLKSKSPSVGLGHSCPRIDPKQLLFLLCFVSRARNADTYMEEYNATIEKCISECLIGPLTNKPIPPLGVDRDFSPIQIKQYIESWNRCEKELAKQLANES